MSTQKQLEKDVKALQDRNRRVEAGKAWELSYTRRLIITSFTYLAIGVYFWVIKIPKPWLNAIVPAVAFMLSTLTMPFFKRQWLKYRK